MIHKLFFTFVTSIVIGAFGTSCSEDISECPSKMCVIAGGWKLSAVYHDDEIGTIDLSKYQLILYTPSPATEAVSNFDRTQPSGNTDNGSWSIQNNDTILRLIPGNNPLLTEDWIIESFTPRQLILVINRDTGIKDGPNKIRYVLEPF